MSFCLHANSQEDKNLKHIKARLIDKGLNSDSLPIFEYDTYNVKPGEKNNISILLPLNAKDVSVEVTDVKDAIALNLDGANKNSISRIIFSRTLRNKQGAVVKSGNELTDKAVFNLRKAENQGKITQAIDYKSFEFSVKTPVPATYFVKATVDDNETTTAIIVTKSGLEINYVSPPIIDFGVETLITVQGEELKSTTQLKISGDDIEIKEINSLNKGLLKAKIFVPQNAKPGYRDVTLEDQFLGKATLAKALYIGPKIGKDGKDGASGKDGSVGPQGLAGKDGKSICLNPEAQVKTEVKTLLPGSQANVSVDPVECKITFEIPAGFNGANGLDGSNGKGLCRDRNAVPATVTKTISAGAQANVLFDPIECKITYEIPKGDTGLAGINCWDTNGNRINDEFEDTNNDGVFNGADCQAEELALIEDVVKNWDKLSDEKEFTTASGHKTRMVYIPYFLHDGELYGGFWVDKYEASKAVDESGNIYNVAVSKRKAIPWTNIDLQTAQTISKERVIPELGQCSLIGMREWYTLYLLGRESKTKTKFGATVTSGWNERGNTRSTQDGREPADASKKCTENSQSVCLSGTGFKSWGHLLDASATKDIFGESLGDVADLVKDDNSGSGTDTSDDDLQVYDLCGNVAELINISFTRSTINDTEATRIDPPYEGATFALPYTANNKYFSFNEIVSTAETQYIDLLGLGLPFQGKLNKITDENGAANDGKLFTSNTNNKTYQVSRGGYWGSGDASRSPLSLDISKEISYKDLSIGFRVVCED